MDVEYELRKTWSELDDEISRLQDELHRLVGLRTQCERLQQLQYELGDPAQFMRDVERFLAIGYDS